MLAEKEKNKRKVEKTASNAAAMQGDFDYKITSSSMQQRIFLPFLALIPRSPIDGMASNISLCSYYYQLYTRGH